MSAPYPNRSMKNSTPSFWISISLLTGITGLCVLWLALYPRATSASAAHGTTMSAEPALHLSVEPGFQTLEANASARFTITVQNTGSEALTELRAEASFAACQQPLANTLAPGAVTGYTCATGPLRADFTLELAVFATGAGGIISQHAVATVDVIAPEIHVALAPSSRQILAGSPATFTVTVTNRGEYTLTHVVTDDPALPDCSRTEQRVLPVGAHLAYTCGLDNVMENLTHTIFVEGSPPAGRIVTDTATARIQIIDPALSLTLLPATQTVPRHGQAELTVRVANSGDAALDVIAIDAPLAPDCTLTETLRLNPGELTGYTCAVAVTNTDFTVNATARALTPVGTELTARASAAIDVLAPDITLHAAPLSQTVTTGELAAVAYTLTNVGNYTLSPVTLTVASTAPYVASCDRTAWTELPSGAAESVRCTVPNVTSPLSQTATVAGLYSGEAADEPVNDSIRVDMDAFPFATVSGRAWEDINGDGLRDAAEPGLEGVTVRALSLPAGAVADTALTAADGAYALRRVPPGRYRIAFEPPPPYRFSPPHQGDAPDRDSDPDAQSGQTDELPLAELEVRTSVDAGLYRPPQVGGQLWRDGNANGVRDPGENGLPSVAVTLLRAGEPVSVTVSHADGLYAFGEIPPGSYAVEVALLDARSQFSPRPEPTEPPKTEQTVSTVDPTTGRTEAETLLSGAVQSGLNAGIYRRALVAGRVWNDANLNGLQDPAEDAVPDVIVRLFSEGGALVGAATTDAAGRYIFTDVNPGRYVAQFEPGGGYSFASFRHRGSDPALDSDVGADGLTERLTLDATTEVRTLDAAVAQLGNTDAAVHNLAADGLRNGVELLWLPNHALQGDASISRFRLWRSETGNRADAVLITPQPLRITAAPHEQHYFDTAVRVGQRYSYWIESEDVRGTMAEFGPVSASADPDADRTVSHLYLPLGVRPPPADD